MNRCVLLVGAVLGLVSVVLGAVVDHSVELNVSDADSIETALRYNMIYSVLIVALSLAPVETKLYQAAYVFIVGAVFFSFSIYASVLLTVPYIIYLTPFGGVTLMMAWVFLIIRAFQIKREP